VANPTYTFRSVAAIGAIGVTLLGAVPMAAAAINPHADPVLAQAVDGAPQTVNSPAPPFSLVDQHGTPVSLARLKGKTIALTFLDDTCTTDCPVIAQEFRTADSYLGGDARRVEMVAVNANPRFITPDYLAAFDRQEGLTHMANWLYLTGPLPELRRIWRAYGILVVYEPGGAMVSHSEYAYVIDATGHTRDVLDTDPGPATEATKASFAVMLADTIKTVLAKR
jgi:cytochrome oxidase Cu insertion factor (SCO1/SenC/PrrC family)